MKLAMNKHAIQFMQAGYTFSLVQVGPKRGMKPSKREVAYSAFIVMKYHRVS